jgi:hypothetical protein
MHAKYDDGMLELRGAHHFDFSLFSLEEYQTIQEAL